MVRERAVALRIGRDRQDDVGILRRLATIGVEHDEARNALEGGPHHGRIAPCRQVGAVQDERREPAGTGRFQELIDLAVGHEPLEAETLRVGVLVGLDEEIVVKRPGRRPGDGGDASAERSAEPPEEEYLLVRCPRRDDDADAARPVLAGEVAESSRHLADRARPGPAPTSRAASARSSGKTWGHG